MLTKFVYFDARVSLKNPHLHSRIDEVFKKRWSSREYKYWNKEFYLSSVSITIININLLELYMDRYSEKNCLRTFLPLFSGLILKYIIATTVYARNVSLGFNLQGEITQCLKSNSGNSINSTANIETHIFSLPSLR